MISVQFADSILNAAGSAPVSGALLERAVLETLRRQEAPTNADATIVLSDDAHLHELNRQFLSIDAPTDVLSFPSGETDPDSDAPYLGDVIISYPRALDQAAAGGHSVEAELQLLVVHGVLHLLGHDHAAAEEKAAMWSAQAEVLEALGSSVHMPPL